MLIYECDNYGLIDTFFISSAFGILAPVVSMSFIQKTNLLIINTSSNFYFYDLSNSFNLKKSL